MCERTARISAPIPCDILGALTISLIGLYNQSVVFRAIRSRFVNRGPGAFSTRICVSLAFENKNEILTCTGKPSVANVAQANHLVGCSYRGAGSFKFDSRSLSTCTDVACRAKSDPQAEKWFERFVLQLQCW